MNALDSLTTILVAIIAALCICLAAWPSPDQIAYQDAPGYTDPICWEAGEFQPTDGCLGI